MNIGDVKHLGDLYKDSQTSLDAVRAQKPDLVIVQEESLLFRGLAGALRESGLSVVGADIGPSILERDKLIARQIIAERFPEFLPKILAQFAPGTLTNTSLPNQCVVRTRTVNSPNTTVIVTDEASKNDAVQLAQTVEILVEEYVEGTPLTYYVFTNGRHVRLSPPLKTYPFRHSKDQGPKTGGMGSVTVRDIANEHLTYATGVVEAMAQHLVHELCGSKKRLQCFSIEVIASEDKVAYIESDVRLGDPEVCSLQAVMKPGDLGRLLISLAHDELPEYTTQPLNSMSVVLAPTDYPGGNEKIIRNTGWINYLQKSEGALHLGRIKQLGQKYIWLSGSRSAVYTKTGQNLHSVRAATYRDLQAAPLPSELDYRTDIGL